MKHFVLQCRKCGWLDPPKITGSPKSGMHVKASCAKCGAYIKFLNKHELERLSLRSR